MTADNPLHIGYFDLARNVSKYSNHPRAKMGCVIANHKPKGVGFNQYNKSHTRFCNPLFTLSSGVHCEVLAMRNTGKSYMPNSVAYVYRETADGKPAMARPCTACMVALREFGVKKVYYTIKEEPFYRMEKI